MATLSQKTTSGDSSFDKYVKQNPRYSEIKYEIEHGMQSDLFVKKGTKFFSVKTLKAGTKFNIVENNLTDVGGLKCAKVKVVATIGYIPISKIRKPTVGNGTSYETEVIDALNEIFTKIARPINIKLGNKTYTDLTYAVKVDTAMKRSAGISADPKADIIICKDKKNPLAPGSIYISHKKSGGPEAFQQYGGLTEISGLQIYQHPEVQSFLRQTTEFIKGGVLKKPLMKPIKDEKLMNMSIYGPGYGEQFSLQHVQLIGQGKPKLTQTDARRDLYKLEFTDHMSLSGDLKHFVNGYLPVFGATYRAGRGFKFNNIQYLGARVGIYPRKLIATRTGLVTLK